MQNTTEPSGKAQLLSYATLRCYLQYFNPGRQIQNSQKLREKASCRALAVDNNPHPRCQVWPRHCHQNCRRRTLGHPRLRRRSPGAKISLVLSPYCKCRGHERILCSIERLPHHVSKEPPNRTPPSVDTVTGFPCQEIHLSRVSTIVPTSRTSKGLVIDCSGFSLVRTKYIFPSHRRTSKLTWSHRTVSPLVSAGCSTSWNSLPSL